MRYRMLDPDGDMLFGHGNADFLHDSPEAVAQAALTRLRLLRGEWFLDVTSGTPYVPLVLGQHTRESYDLAIRERVLDTAGVRSITAYESGLDGETRRLSIRLTIDTIYGEAVLQEVL